LSYHFEADDLSSYLHIFSFGIYITYPVELRFIYMAKGEMIEQVTKSEDAQLFFQQVGSLRANTFQVFNGI
jgi:hypothetical protein